jgi:hypothetical protein
MIIALIFLLFFLSRITINEFFYFFHRLFKNKNTVFTIVSLIYLPGTIIHELAHYFMALILFLHVREIKIFPEWAGSQIKLGHVIYEKRDFLRGVIVGLAPIFLGLGLFYWLAVIKIFPGDNVYLNVLLGYFIFTVSSTMFSSKQDMVDLIYLIPVILIIIALVYIFNININLIFNNPQVISTFETVSQNINLYLLISSIINIALIVLLKTLRSLFP